MFVKVSKGEDKFVHFRSVIAVYERLGHFRRG